MSLRLTSRDRRQIIRLLGLLQTHLESAIDSSLVPGTSRPMPEDAHNVALDREDWKAAEKWVKRLEHPLRRSGRRGSVPADIGD